MDRRETLLQKQQRKMNLRDHSYIKPKKFVQYDEEQQEKQIESKSRKWWQKVNRRYFTYKSQKELTCLQNTLMQDYCLMAEVPPQKGQSYFQKNLLLKYSKLFEKNSIKVLFQNNMTNDFYGDSTFMTYTFGIKHTTDSDQQQHYNDAISLQSSHEHTEWKQNINVTYMKEQPQQQVSMGKQKLASNEKQLCQVANELQLNFGKSSNDIDFLTQCNYFDLTKYQYYQSEIDREIDLWSAELRKVEVLNESVWQEIYKNFREQEQVNRNSEIKHRIAQGYNMDDDIKSIHDALTWRHNLVNIKMGFADKNQEMLAQALQGMWIKQHKTKNMGEKKRFFKASLENLMQTKSELSNIFETDCKVCFSTYVSQKNKVIYCDNCNQSFHEKCYGITDLNEDPNSKFYCDSCQYTMSNTHKSIQTNSCQLCSVLSFPLKKIDAFFFHPSCLFLNNLLKPQLGQLKLDEQINPQSIIQTVRQFQQQNQHNQCQYCAQKCKTGLRFKCSQPQCNKHFHSLCAYLNSCVFDIWRVNEKLQTEIRCWEHYPKRDNARQAYLRRFFCNYKNISDLSQIEFIQVYRQQLSSIQDYKQDLKNNNSNSLSQKQSQKINSKKKLKPKSQIATSNSVIDLNSSHEHQNVNCQSQDSISHASSHKNHTLVHRNHTIAEQQPIKINSRSIKTDIDQLSREVIQISKKNHINPIQNPILTKLQSYLSTINMETNINMDSNSDIETLKQYYPFLTESNTNSNNSDNLEKKIIEE